MNEQNLKGLLDDVVLRVRLDNDRHVREAMQREFRQMYGEVIDPINEEVRAGFDKFLYSKQTPYVELARLRYQRTCHDYEKQLTFLRKQIASMEAIMPRYAKRDEKTGKYWFESSGSFYTPTYSDFSDRNARLHSYRTIEFLMPDQLSRSKKSFTWWEHKLYRHLY